MTEKKEKIYRVSMRLCRMWGVAETLTGDVGAYESTKDDGVLLENEERVLQWAEEFMNLQDSGCPLSDFFEAKISELRHGFDDEEEQLPFPDETFPVHLPPTKKI